MDYFFQFVIWIVVAFTLLATIKLSFKGILSFPDNRIANFVSSPFWCLSLMILFGLVGEFGRNESSPLPWVTFANTYSKHGTPDAIGTLICVVIVDLWIFWTPSQIYKSHINEKKQKFIKRYNNNTLNHEKEEVRELVKLLEYDLYNYAKSYDKKRVIFARVINVLTGLLLATPHNPFYILLGRLSGLD